MINVSKERFHFDDEEDVVIQTPKKKAEKKPTPKEMGIKPSNKSKKKIKTRYIVLGIVAVLVLALGTNLLKSSTAGPGSMHAPIIISLIGGLLFGAFAQKSRMCFAGSIRDIILMKNFDLITIVVGFFAVMLVYNVATGHFVLAFNTPGVIAHSQHLWSILGMYAVGFAAVLAGGCPLRQLVLAGQGSSDAGVTVIGMFAGGALAHNLGLAASGTALNAETGEIVAGAVPPAGKIAAIICIIVCFVIAFTNKRSEAK